MAADAALALAAGLGAALAGATAVLRPRLAARAAARAGWLDGCRDLFEAPVLRLAPSGLPRLSGRRGGVRWDVQALEDSLSFRKLPVLWLMVTRLEAGRAASRLEALRKPSGAETFTDFAALPVAVVPPEGWPDHCALRADRPGPPPVPAEALLRALDDPRVKSVLVAPQGQRLVWTAEESDRGRYLLFREAELARRPLEPALLLGVMARLEALAAALPRPAQAPGPRAAAA